MHRRPTAMIACIASNSKCLQSKLTPKEVLLVSAAHQTQHPLFQIRLKRACRSRLGKGCITAALICACCLHEPSQGSHELMTATAQYLPANRCWHHRMPYLMHLMSASEWLHLAHHRPHGTAEEGLHCICVAALPWKCIPTSPACCVQTRGPSQ